ncbi:hypothetical protein N2152v2_004633 [Parachlorella kessleri]
MEAVAVAAEGAEAGAAENPTLELGPAAQEPDGSVAPLPPSFVDAAVQTVLRADASVQYEAPATLADSEEVQQQLSSTVLSDFLGRAVPVCEQALQQNELADALKDEFAGLAEDDAADGSASGLADRVAVHQSFTDVLYSKGRALPAVQWHPVRKGVMAVACAELLNLSERAHQPLRVSQAAPTGILVWDYRDPTHPEAVLQAPSDVFAFAFNPAQPQWVAAGCLGGQVALWNLDELVQQREQAAKLQMPAGSHSSGSGRDGPAGADEGIPFLKASVLQPAFMSTLDASHQACITDLIWLPGLTATRDSRLEPSSGLGECNLFATTAMDGRGLVWDMRIHSGGRRRNRPTATEDDVVEWKPVLSLVLQGGSRPLTCSRLCLDSKPSSTIRLLLGSLEGEVVAVDANIRAVDTSRTHNTVGYATTSFGRVRWLGYSPFFDDLLLAVADSGFTIWQDQGGELRQQPLFESRYSEVLYSTGCWSPTKPGVVLLGRLDGKVEIWDLLDRVHMPVVVAAITPAAILSLAFSPGPSGTAAGRSSVHQVLAVADAAGVLHVVDLPRTLRRRGHGEVKGMAALVQRELGRLTYIQERQAARAKLLKGQQPRRHASVQLASGGPGSLGASMGDQQADGTQVSPGQQAELAYQQLEQEWRVKLGLATAPIPA